MLHPILAALVATVFAASTVAAQRTVEVLPGSRVRLTVPLLIDGTEATRIPRPAIGTVLGVDSVSLTARMEQDGTELTVPFSAISRLQVSRGPITAAQGRRDGVRKGVLLGGGAALAVYAVAYVIDAATEDLAEENCRLDELFCEYVTGPDLKDATLAVGVGTLGGALIGFVAGGRESERWQEVRPRTLRPAAAPREIALSISLAF